MQSYGNKNPLNKFLKTQASSKDERPYAHHNRGQSSYNLKDFLPSSSIIMQQRGKKKSSYTTNNINSNSDINQMTPANLTSTPPLPQDISLLNNNNIDLKLNKSTFLNINLDQRLFQQKMNKLKQQNMKLKQKIQSQQQTTKKQAEQINQLKYIIKKYQQKQQQKYIKNKLWSYKYHYDYVPYQSMFFIIINYYQQIEHKYQLAVQTDDIDHKYKSNSKELKAKDFQEIYRKLNINKNNQKNINKNINLDGNKNKKNTQSSSNSTAKGSNLTFFNNKNTNQNNKNKQTINSSKKFQLFNIPTFQDFLSQQNKQNNINQSNIIQNQEQFQDDSYQKQQNYDIYDKNNKNSNNLIKKYSQQIQIYPVDQEYLDSIVEDIMNQNSTRY